MGFDPAPCAGSTAGAARVHTMFTGVSILRQGLWHIHLQARVPVDPIVGTLAPSILVSSGL